MRRVRLVVVAALAVLVGASGHGADAAAPRAAVTAVGAIAMTVSSADRSAAFYADVLGFARVSDVEVAGEAWERLLGVGALRLRIVRMRLGDESIDLMEYRAPRGRPIPEDSRSQDHWFQHVAIIVSDMDRAYARLRAAGVEHVSPAPQRLPDWNPNAGGIRAFYFKDPDAHVLEVLSFPPGKGAGRWHRDDALFLGIDHTAIVVGDTARSLACYRDALGLTVAGESDNWGPEQERLNNVPGARLHITTLRAPAGPGIELLQYRAPRDGRPAPADTRANDLVHWQTSVMTSDAVALVAALRDGACSTLRPTVVAGPESEPGSPYARERRVGRAFLARDPDAHTLRIVEPAAGALARRDRISG
jgi:catechol 2,3-dioxygenase-like lactoylglutathione lyase family enzyme